MPFGMESGDRKFLLTAGGLLAALTGLALLSGTGAGGTQGGLASSYSTASDGSKAAYALLADLGYSPERWNRPPQDLPLAPGTELVLADPMVPASSEERSALVNFVRHGGRVLITGVEGGKLLAAASLSQARRAGEWNRFQSEAPSPLTLNAPEISMNGAVRWQRPPAEALPCFGDNEGATVVEIRLGKGTLIWWADSSPLTNYGLTQSSNLALFLNSVGPKFVSETARP